MGVRKSDDARAVDQRGEVERLAGGMFRSLRQPVDPQPRDAAVGKDVQAQMRPDACVPMRDEMVAVRPERRHWHDQLPFGVGIGFAAGGQAAGLDRAGRRVVAGEMAGVDVETVDDRRRGERDDRVVVARSALAPRFPAVHPLAVLVVFVRDEHRVVVGEHARRLGEKVVADGNDPGAEPRGREIGIASGEIGG